MAISAPSTFPTTRATESGSQEMLLRTHKINLFLIVAYLGLFSRVVVTTTHTKNRE